VPALKTEAICECVDEPGDIQTIPGQISPILKSSPAAFSEPIAAEGTHFASSLSAAALIAQDVRRAGPNVWVTSEPEFDWESRYDLIGSGPDDKHFVVEIDNFGKAHLRFGKNGRGYPPAAGMTFQVSYRAGNGIAGNVGAESIGHVVFKKTKVASVTRVRNLLPAKGGTEPEPMAEAKLFAPHAFRKTLDRAVIACDYQKIASRNTAVQRSSAVLEWTGSWYEANVAIDPLGRTPAPESLIETIQHFLDRYRRMGHDLRVESARYVPILLGLDVCVLPHYPAGHVKTALLNAFSNRILPGSKRGFFHPDNLTFGEGIYLSKIIATAQAVTGVECVRVTKLQRLFDAPNHEIARGVLPLQSNEIGQLDNDPNHPERGRLEIHVSGGR
jgi:predicted phage baseplate assembly protein